MLGCGGVSALLFMLWLGTMLHKKAPAAGTRGHEDNDELSDESNVDPDAPSGADSLIDWFVLQVLCC